LIWPLGLEGVSDYFLGDFFFSLENLIVIHPRFAYSGFQVIDFSQYLAHVILKTSALMWLKKRRAWIQRERVTFENQKVRVEHYLISGNQTTIFFFIFLLFLKQEVDQILNDLKKKYANRD
jgi:hypothetical protein